MFQQACSSLLVTENSFFSLDANNRMEQVGEDGGSSMLSYIEFLTYLFIKNKRILSSVMMIYNELRRSDGFILRRSS